MCITRRKTTIENIEGRQNSCDSINLPYLKQKGEVKHVNVFVKIYKYIAVIICNS